MKRITWLILLLAVASMMPAMNGTILVSSEQTKVQLTSINQSGMTVQYSVGKLEYQDVATSHGNFTEISIDKYTTTNQIGLPKLPLLRQIIKVPMGAVIIPRLSNKVTAMVSLSNNGITNRIMPRQESVSKSVDAATVPFESDNDFYNGTAWTDNDYIKVEEIGMMRGTRLVALDFVPVRYNPSTAQLEVITSATIELTYDGADWAATEDLSNRYYSPVFESSMAQTVFNYENTRTSLDRYPLGMIIITPQNYVTTLQPFVNWKKMQGYNVTVATTNVTGTTTSAIKTYLQNIWNNATAQNPAPSYLILVGDTPQIPAWTSSTLSGHVSDLSYVRLQGTDYVPEMYFGRFSATNTTQLQAIIDKTLQYEMYTMPDPSYLSHTALIAGVDTSNGPTYGNGQIRYGKDNYFGESTSPNWTPYGPYQIRNHMYLYPASGSSDAQIIQNMNDGLGYINYTAHGSDISWGDPTLTVSNINAMTNANKYFVAVGNCCLTNHFDTGECFGEAFIRASNKGAVAYIGANNSSYWDEDYYWAVGHKPPVVGTGSPYIPNKIGAYDAAFHYHNEAYGDWAGTLGAMNFMGNMAVVAYNQQKTNYYWEIYSIMGDPSLIPYMGIPAVNNTQYSPTIPIGFSTMQITAEPNTYVAISQDNVLHGAGFTDSNGNLVLNFTPFTAVGTAKLVMTRSLCKPVIATINITANSGPYLLLNTITVNDGNNAIAEAGETMYLDVTLQNVGTVAANNITATLTSTSPYVNIIQGNASVANIQTNATSTIANIFRVLISPAIPDQQEIELTFQMHDNASNSWTETRNLTVNAPNISFGSPTYHDPNNNGSYEPGETITINFNINNNGHMNANSGTLVVVNNSDYATIGQSTYSIPNINIGGNALIAVSATISETAPTGIIVPIGIAFSAGSQLVNGMLSLMIGSVADGFETGVINSSWVNPNPLHPAWTIVSGSSVAHSGSYCIKSGAIGIVDSTIISITKNVSAPGSISFWRKVSSEDGFDVLKFFIDNVVKDTWSGTQPWTQISYQVSAGSHTFKWRYSKDYSGSVGSDCAWVDDIVFPISGDANVPIFYSPVTALNFNNVPVNSIVTKDFLIRNLGPATLTGTINVPQLVTLLENGIPVSDTYNFNVPANSNKLYTVQILETSVMTYDGAISITTNDSNYPSHQINLHVNSVVSNEPDAPIVATKLDGNYPNPFNPVTSIRFSTKEPGNVSIVIYNSKGQVVRSLVNENKKSGSHSVVWNGTDDYGKPVSSGIYLYKMQTQSYSQIKKMMLMK